MRESNHPPPAINHPNETAPFRHLGQMGVPSCAANVAIGHCVHEEAPLGDQKPSAHGSHTCDKKAFTQANIRIDENERHARERKAQIE